MADKDFTVNVPGIRRVRVAVETELQEFRNRYVQVYCSVPLTDAEIMEKARAAFRRTYGEKPRIVAIDVNCPQTQRGNKRVRD